MEQPLEMITILRGGFFFEQLVWLGSYSKKDEAEPTFRPLLLENVELWISRLQETMNGPSCTTMIEYSGRADRWIRGRGWPFRPTR